MTTIHEDTAARDALALLTETRKCADCAHVEDKVFDDRAYVQCDKGYWDPGVDHWWAISSLIRNRQPLRAFAPACKDYTPRP